MAKWNCDFENCDRPSVRTYGDTYGECTLCNRHLCAKHLESQYHTCPTWEVRNVEIVKSPIVLLPVADFYDGANHISENEVIFAQLLEEKGHTNLGRIVRNGRLLHHFQFCCGYDIEDWEGFLGLFLGLLRALGDLSWDT